MNIPKAAEWHFSARLILPIFIQKLSILLGMAEFNQRLVLVVIPMV